MYVDFSCVVVEHCETVGGTIVQIRLVSASSPWCSVSPLQHLVTVVAINGSKSAPCEIESDGERRGRLI